MTPSKPFLAEAMGKSTAAMIKAMAKASREALLSTKEFNERLAAVAQSVQGSQIGSGVDFGKEDSTVVKVTRIQDEYIMEEVQVKKEPIPFDAGDSVFGERAVEEVEDGI